MTTEERVLHSLESKGLSANQAKIILDKAKPEIKIQGSYYQITWHRDADEYPAVLYPLLDIFIKPTALAWIEENIPDAWFKDMFK